MYDRQQYTYILVLPLSHDLFLLCHDLCHDLLHGLPHGLPHDLPHDHLHNHLEKSYVIKDFVSTKHHEYCSLQSCFAFFTLGLSSFNALTKGQAIPMHPGQAIFQLLLCVQKLTNIGQKSEAVYLYRHHAPCYLYLLSRLLVDLK